ncbi:hypothetical protein Tco_0988140 [Tanacetum coccineum]|uniref:Gag-Pol polyprotein n=1 Tax=Tanacetum coccineum TaxID=301880 RepID=A0ABQ5EQ41_9ASTR
MSTQQDIYAAGSENRPPMLNKENYVPWSSRLLRYAKSRPNGKLIYNSIMNGPYVRRMIPEPGDADREVPVNETFHEQTDDELTEKELKQVEADDQAIQTILLGLPEDIYAAVDSCETAQEIWLRVQQMMKGFDIGIQEKKATLFNEWERFTSTDGESIESYYHRFSKLMNDFKRNKHFPEKIASNLKFLNNLQPEWSRHVTIVHQTKDLHTTDYTQLYDFLKYNQKEVDDLRAERLAKTHDPLALMANTNNPFNYPVFYQDQPSSNPTTAMNMALVLMAKAFKLNYSTPTNNNQRISSNPRNRQIAQPGMNIGQDKQMQMVVQNAIQNPGVQNVGNQNGLIIVSRIANQNPNRNGNVVAARGKGNTIGNNAVATDLDEIEEVNANFILMANLQQASTSGTQTNKAPVYDSDGSVENDSNVIYEVSSVEQEGGTVDQHLATIKETQFSDDATPSVAQKFLNEVKHTIVTLQRVVKQKMTLDIHNWSSSAHQEIYKFVKDEIFRIVNQVDARVQNFKIQFLKEAAKFIRDFKSLAKEVDESLAKHKALELEIECLLKVVFSQDIMSIVQNPSIVDSSNLQTELERMKEQFEICILKKENEYAKLWNDRYKKYEECKYKKISYDKAYNDMQQKIERLQAQLGDQKGNSKDTPCVSNTLDLLSQKLENKNVELEFQVWNYEKENAHLKTTYKNLFDSISMTQAQTKTIIDSLQDKLHDMIYENAKLRAQLFDKVSEQKGLPKINKTHALSKPVTSNSVPTPQESKVMSNDKVITPGMFRINPFKPSREEKYVPNKVRASIRTNPITVSQPHVITKKDVNSESNGLSSIGVDNTAKTRRPQPRSNTKNDKVPSASKSSCNKNKEVEVEEHPRNLLLSKNTKHMSSECNNVKLAIQNDKSKVVCAMCNQFLITANHDVCVLNYVNDMNSRDKKQKANILNTENQKKQKPKVMKLKKVRSNERLASPKPSKPRSLRWSPTGILFDLKGKIIPSSESKSYPNFFMVRRLQRKCRKPFQSSNMRILLHQDLKDWIKPTIGFRYHLTISIHANLDEVSMDDLYKNLKVYEAEIKSQSSSSSNFQNVAFVSSDDTSSTNEAVNTAHDVPAASSKR